MRPLECWVVMGHGKSLIGLPTPKERVAEVSWAVACYTGAEAEAQAKEHLRQLQQAYRMACEIAPSDGGLAALELLEQRDRIPPYAPTVASFDKVRYRVFKIPLVVHLDQFLEFVDEDSYDMTNNGSLNWRGK